MPSGMPTNSGAGFYNPGGIQTEYEKVHNKPELPGVGLPNPNDTGAAGSAAGHTPCNWRNGLLIVLLTPVQSHASHGRSPGKGRARMTTGTSGPTFSSWSRR